jgi:hypothetical protein
MALCVWLSPACWTIGFSVLLGVCLSSSGCYVVCAVAAWNFQVGGAWVFRSSGLGLVAYLADGGFHGEHPAAEWPFVLGVLQPFERLGVRCFWGFACCAPDVPFVSMCCMFLFFSILMLLGYSVPRLKVGRLEAASWRAGGWKAGRLEVGGWRLKAGGLERWRLDAGGLEGWRLQAGRWRL